MRTALLPSDRYFSRAEHPCGHPPLAPAQEARSGLCQSAIFFANGVRLRAYNLPLQPDGVPTAHYHLRHAGKLFWIQHDYFVINHVTISMEGNPQTTSIFLRLAVREYRHKNGHDLYRPPCPSRSFCPTQVACDPQCHLQ
jgi:hypothetical protein